MTPIGGTQVEQRGGRAVLFFNPLFWFGLAVHYQLHRQGLCPAAGEFSISPFMVILAETVGNQQGWLVEGVLSNV